MKLKKAWVLYCKTKVGKGSSDLYRIDNEEQFRNIENKNLFISQELIGDEDSEYTCGVYKSKFGYKKIIVMRRHLHNGSTIMAEVKENKIIKSYCENCRCN